MTDYTDWTRTPIRFEDVKAGDVIEGEIDGGKMQATLAATVVEGTTVDEDDVTFSILVDKYHLEEGKNWTLRKLTPPTPQWPVMAPLTSLGQMAEGLIEGESHQVVKTALRANSCTHQFRVFGPSKPDAYGQGFDHWTQVEPLFDPGSLHPITAEPIELTVEQVRMLPDDAAVINAEGYPYRFDMSSGHRAPYSLIHYPKEK